MVKLYPEPWEVIIMMIIIFNVIDLRSIILINAKFATIVNNYSAYTKRKC